jgi:RimJ/RimL family protein N-acetyltransferase
LEVGDRGFAGERARMSLILETPRLTLRELTLRDLDFVAAMLAHPEVMRFWPKTCTRAEAEAWIRQQQERYAREGYGYWLAAGKAAGQPIGQAGLLRQEVDGVTETGIGYLIHRPFWRQGYATEAAAACRDHAFDQLGRERVVVLVRPENVVSARVAEKIGFLRERETIYAGFAHTVFVKRRKCRAPLRDSDPGP